LCNTGIYVKPAVVFMGSLVEFRNYNFDNNNNIFKLYQKVKLHTILQHGNAGIIE
jgi:hypothetical protein